MPDCPAPVACPRRQTRILTMRPLTHPTRPPIAPARCLGVAQTTEILLQIEVALPRAGPFPLDILADRAAELIDPQPGPLHPGAGDADMPQLARQQIHLDQLRIGQVRTVQNWPAQDRHRADWHRATGRRPGSNSATGRRADPRPAGPPPRAKPPAVVAPLNLAPRASALAKRAPQRSASAKSAPSSNASSKLANRRTAPVNRASSSSASVKLAWLAAAATKLGRRQVGPGEIRLLEPGIVQRGGAHQRAGEIRTRSGRPAPTDSSRDWRRGTGPAEAAAGHPHATTTASAPPSAPGRSRRAATPHRNAAHAARDGCPRVLADGGRHPRSLRPSAGDVAPVRVGWRSSEYRGGRYRSPSVVSIRTERAGCIRC